MSENNYSFHQELKKEYFDEIKRLNMEGTERSRNRILVLELEQKNLEEQIKGFSKWKDAHESENDYDFKNAKFGNNLISKDIIPRQNKKIDLAVTYSQDASRNTADANKAAQMAVTLLEEGRKDNRKFIRGFLVSIILLVLATVFSQTMKLLQDSNNQKQTVQYLETLTKQLQKAKP